MLGYLLAVQQRLKDRGGKLRLCRLNPQLTGLFRRLMLNRLFTICADEEEAVEHNVAWSGARI
jgi:anti-anti-sigma regulatory factor